LNMQAHKAFDSPRPGRRGRGADLPARLSTPPERSRASATAGLPGTRRLQPTESLMGSQDTSHGQSAFD
jgi:hypothetical protein